MYNGCVYILKDPRDNSVRYVGKTLNYKKRVREHIYSAKNKTSNSHLAVTKFIKFLVKNNLPIIFEPLQSFSNEDVDILNEWLFSAEVYWIKYFKDGLNNLLNCTIGGEGMPGNPGNKFPKTVRRIVDQNGIVYPSISEAARINNLSAGNIACVLSGKVSSTKNMSFAYEESGIIPQKHVNRPQRTKIQDHLGRVYNSILEAEKILGISNIIKCINGENRSSGGFAFSLVGEPIPTAPTTKWILPIKVKSNDGRVYNSIKEAAEKNGIGKTTVARSIKEHKPTWIGLSFEKYNEGLT